MVIWPLWLVYWVLLFSMAEGGIVATGFAYYLLYCNPEFPKDSF